MSAPNLRVGAIAAALLVLGGCSQVPDALNPAEWYRSTVDFVSGTEAPADQAENAEPGTPGAERNEPPPGADQPFPNLATVPDRPAVSSASERREIAEGLVADRAAARRYADPVTAQPSAPVNPLRRESAPAAQSPSGAPAVPVPPVSSPVPVPAPGTTSATPPAPPTVAATPAPVAATAPMTVEEIYRNRLNQKRPAEPVAGTLAGAGQQPSLAQLEFDTVVITSGGLAFNRAGGSGGNAGATAPTAQQAGLSGSAARPSPAAGQGGELAATIYFVNGSSDLATRDRYILRQVAAIVEERSAAVRVVGHASSRTRPMEPERHVVVNFRMSSARAQSVAQALVDAGIPRDRITVEAVSDTQPDYYEIMPTGEAGNRRVEIFLVR